MHVKQFVLELLKLLLVTISLDTFVDLNLKSVLSGLNPALLATPSTLDLGSSSKCPRSMKLCVLCFQLSYLRFRFLRKLECSPAVSALRSMPSALPSAPNALSRNGRSFKLLDVFANPMSAPDPLNIGGRTILFRLY